MSRVIAIVTTVLVLLLLSALGCNTVASPTPIDGTAPASVSPRAPAGTPEYVTLTFTVETYSEYVFPIYVGNEQTLHLLWLVKEGNKVWFHIVTPSGKLLGFYDNGQFANGTLTDSSCKGFIEGRTTFSPSQYDWGEGYYELIVTSHSSNPSELEVRYWIEDEAATGETIENELMIEGRG